MDKIADIFHPKRRQDGGDISVEGRLRDGRAKVASSETTKRFSLIPHRQRLLRETRATRIFRTLRHVPRRFVAAALAVFVVVSLVGNFISDAIGAVQAMRIVPATSCSEEFLVRLPGVSETTPTPRLSRARSSEGGSPSKEEEAVAGEKEGSSGAEMAPLGEGGAPQEVGGWFGADRAQGMPDLPLDANASLFSINNSALWRGGSTPIVCSGFTVPPGRHLNPALGLSLAIRSTLSVPEVPTQEPSPSITPTPTESPEVIFPEESPAAEPLPTEEPTTPPEAPAPQNPAEEPPAMPSQEPQTPSQPQEPQAPSQESPLSVLPMKSWRDRLRAAFESIALADALPNAYSPFGAEAARRNTFASIFSAIRARLFAAVVKPNVLSGEQSSVDAVLRISLWNGTTWKSFHVLDQVPFSNGINGDYLQIDLPQKFANNLDTLKVRIEGIRSGDPNLEIYLDSVFISFSAGKAYELALTPLDPQGEEREVPKGEKIAFGRGQDAAFHFKVKDDNKGIIERLNAWASNAPPPQATVSARLKDAQGNEVPDVRIVSRWVGREQFGNEVWEVSLAPLRELPTGRYTLAATFTDEDGNTQDLSQDFLWGVLALNVSKSIYLPNEQVDFAFAVLDEQGAMVCDAELTLAIDGPNLIDTTLSTKDKTITVNPECQQKAKTQKPDYEAHWKLSGIGQTGMYKMRLSATTRNGTHEITDSFEVRDAVPFDVHREGPTRILPTELYEVTITVKANQDFTGAIVEPVPASFVITNQSEVKEITQNVAGTVPATAGGGGSETEPGTSYVTWSNVSLKKGKTYEFSYTYDAPNVSPEFWLTGPLRFYEAASAEGTQNSTAVEPTQNNAEPSDKAQGGEVPRGSALGSPEGAAATDGGVLRGSALVFEEIRQWQIAADAPAEQPSPPQPPLKERRFEKPVRFDKNPPHSCAAKNFSLNLSGVNQAIVEVEFTGMRSDSENLEIGSLPRGIDITFLNNADYSWSPSKSDSGAVLQIINHPGSQKGNFSIPIIYTSGNSTTVCQINIINF